MAKRKSTNEQRKRRHTRVRSAISGTAARPRLNVFRSLNNIYAQLVDDDAGVTLAAASSQDDGVKGYGGNKAAATAVGKALAAAAQKKGIKAVVFDRGGYLYHGRVQALAEGARQGGLEF